jgi:hypothetical protein
MTGAPALTQAVRLHRIVLGSEQKELERSAMLCAGVRRSPPLDECLM